MQLESCRPALLEQERARLLPEPTALVPLLELRAAARDAGRGVRSVGTAERGSIFHEYGLPFRRYGRAYEVDHIVSLELGGSNAAANLYPEAAAPEPGYHEKDRLENRLHRLVCAGQLPLGSVQRAIAVDWVALYAKVYGTNP